MLKQKFIGSWMLKTIIIKNGEQEIFPFGMSIKGYLVYMPDDYMAVQIMIPRHYPVPEKEMPEFRLEDLAQTLKSVGNHAY